jgi:hypothetical protein
MASKTTIILAIALLALVSTYPCLASAQAGSTFTSADGGAARRLMQKVSCARTPPPYLTGDVYCCSGKWVETPCPKANPVVATSG